MATQQELDKVYMSCAENIATLSNASLERYRNEIAAEELKNKQINDASKIFTDSIVGGFESPSLMMPPR